jgi:hypothetical protein
MPPVAEPKTVNGVPATTLVKSTPELDDGVISPNSRSVDACHAATSPSATLANVLAVATNVIDFPFIVRV